DQGRRPMSRPRYALLPQLWKTATMAATASAGEGPLVFLDYLLRFLRVALLLAVWRTILAPGESACGLSRGAVLGYTLAASVFADFLSAHSGLEEALWNGSLVTRFLQPMPVVGHVLAEMVGGWIPGLLVYSLPLLLVAPFLGVNPLPAGPAAALLFPVSLAL